MADYAELHARSAFHFLHGATLPAELAGALAENGITAAACLDRNGLYGAPAFTFACQKLQTHAIVGAELTLCDTGQSDCFQLFGQLPVLVATRQGYHNLCHLITQSRLAWFKRRAREEPDYPQSPSVSLKSIADHANGLRFLTGDDEGPLRVAWNHAGHEGISSALESLLRFIPKKQLYIEIQRHLIREEAPFNRALVQLASSHGIPIIATNGPSFTCTTGRKVLDVFTCLRHRCTLDTAGRLLSPNAERTVKSPEQMTALFRDHPEAIRTTLRLADELTFRLGDLGYAFPRFPVPQGESHDSFLRKMTLFGAEQRYGCLSRQVRRQLDHELATIKHLGFAGYFLIVWDIVNFCRERGIMAQGRGSAANSAVCFALGITAVDPIGGKLLFERFLSEARKGWPDIDIDLPSGDLRESVIQEVYKRYGQNGAAMTANVITYRGRSAMREIAKVIGLPADCVERFNALFPHGDFPQTLPLESQLAKAGISKDNPRHRAAIECFQHMVKLPRHLGQHSGGMIICNGALQEVVPLENASMPNRIVAQWDKDACEDLGIIKIDLLGLGMMAVLQDCIELTHQRGHGVDLARIPKDDPATFDLLCSAETIGVFQVESRAQMATLPRMKPRCFYDLAIEVAIIRPGPIAGELANPYLNRRNGIEPETYLDPRLKPILERTLGIPLFQEQVLSMAMVMADYNATESEQLRRALGFSRHNERIEQAKDAFRRKLTQCGVPATTTEWLVNTISSFALYGFPESHAISFALIAYASAWLKVHRPEEFYCALLNNQPMGFYSPATLIQDARRRGLRFLPPDVTRSQWQCSIETSDKPESSPIRIGLNRVHGVSQKAAQSMLEQRQAAPFQSLNDFRHRCLFAKDELRALAAAGALNSLCRSRRDALWQIEKPVQDDLFAFGDLLVAEQSPSTADDPNPLEEMTVWERVCADFQTTGITVGDHPMHHLRSRLPPSALRAADLEALDSGSQVTVAGAVICRQRPGTAKGVLFLSLEDETGIVNCILWPRLYERVRLTVATEPFLKVVGKTQKAQGTLHVIASSVHRLPFEDAPASASHDFR